MDQAALDARDLAALGHAQVLTRKFGTLSMLALASNILGTWTTLAQSFTTGLENGGPVTVLWGLCLVAACNMCVALSLGELCSSMPTALGQAYWISQIWTSPAGRFASYMCAWINTFGWWSLAASQVAFTANFLLGIKLMFDDAWAPEGWVYFVVFVGLTLLFTAVNHVACRRDCVLPGFNNAFGICFIGLFFVFVLALPISVAVHPELSFRKASFVFGQWRNSTGWSDGVTWFMGLVQAAYALTAFDSVIHMVEEIPTPRRNVPRIMCMAIIVGVGSGFVFMVACLFCIQDFDRLLASTTGLAFLELTHSTLGLGAAASLVSLFTFTGMGQGISLFTSASRLTWSFARDGGIPFGAYFAHVNGYWKAPDRALWLQAAIVSLIGILYLFSSRVLGAILGVSTIALTISYAMPILIVLCHGRDKMPQGEFSLGRFGPLLNTISVVYCGITTVFFFFPESPAPSAEDMNLAIAVFGVMLIVALAFWAVQGRKTFMLICETPEQVPREDASFLELPPRTKEPSRAIAGEGDKALMRTASNDGESSSRSPEAS